MISIFMLKLKCKHIQDTADDVEWWGILQLAIELSSFAQWFGKRNTRMHDWWYSGRTLWYTLIPLNFFKSLHILMSIISRAQKSLVSVSILFFEHTSQTGSSSVPPQWGGFFNRLVGWFCFNLPTLEEISCISSEGTTILLTVTTLLYLGRSPHISWEH